MPYIFFYFSNERIFFIVFVLAINGLLSTLCFFGGKDCFFILIKTMSFWEKVGKSIWSLNFSTYFIVVFWPFKFLVLIQLGFQSWILFSISSLNESIGPFIFPFLYSLILDFQKYAFFVNFSLNLVFLFNFIPNWIN